MSKVKICLDAGHYGSKYNQSPVVKKYYESMMNWKLHLFLKEELLKRGFDVMTTRPEQEPDMNVYDRGAMAKGCSLFLSLHSNACDTESVDYPVIYRAYDNLNNVDSLALPLIQGIAGLMGTKQNGRTATRKNSSGGEYYGVLRGARAVGVPFFMIVEHSFHTNKAATNWLQSDNNLKRLAAMEADILARYYGLQQQAPEESEPESKTLIMGASEATASQMALFCRKENPQPQLPACTLEQLAEMFLEEGHAEGVRGDIAFAQSIKETGYFKYGGIVLPSQNNYAGIGALNGNAQGQAASFPEPRVGVRAQIQHLKAYASDAPLTQPCVDPRFALVTRSTAQFVEWLGAEDNPAGRGWAVPGKGYGSAIVGLLDKILAQEVPEVPGTAPEQPGEPAPPEWQTDGLKTLVDAGIIELEPWESRLGEAITVGEVIGLLGKMA